MRQSLAFAVLLTLGPPAVADDRPTLNIRREVGDRGEVAVLIECPTTVPAGNYSPSDPKLNPAVVSVLPVSVFQDGEKRYLAAVLAPVPTSGRASFKYSAPVSVDYKLHPASVTPDRGVELIPKGKRVEFRVGGKPLTEYIPDDGPKPYFYPLLGPSGAMMTRSYPMKAVEGEKTDHPHQRSLWFTHGSVNKVDFWSEMPGHGSIRETSRPTVVSGLAAGVLRTTDDWLAPDGKKICEDERVVRVYATKNSRTIDFEITLKATNGPVTFGDTKEGMFGLRVATSMDVTSKKGGKIVNAEGLLDKAAWGKPSPWVDYSGPVDDRTVGVAILNHPSSFRYPTTWHVRDYGLFAANPFGWHDFGKKETGEYVLPGGESIRFRYRVVLHDGGAEAADLPAVFKGYEAPPKATVE